MTKNDAFASPSDHEQVTLRSPAELADALPYLVGFHPDDSIVLVALHGPEGRFGGRLRLGIPEARDDWPEVSDQLAECLVTGGERRGSRPDGIIVFLRQDPAADESGQDVMERLRPLAQLLRTACGTHEVPVFEALCVSGGRFWSYCCPDQRCCPAEGTPLGIPGTSVMAAAAAYAGIRVRGSLREMEARLAPLAAPRAAEQEEALETAGEALLPRILGDADSAAVREETLVLLRRMLERFRAAVPIADTAAADLHDDRLLDPGEAAAVIIGLQDRVTRDRAAEWMEGADAEPALRLWRALARRCVGAYVEHAAVPLTLAGWVAWSSGDEPSARVALGRALRADPNYLFAKMLHEACNEGLDPEPLRRCLRRARADQAVHAAIHEELARGSGMASAPDADVAASGPEAPDAPADVSMNSSAAGASTGVAEAPADRAGTDVAEAPADGAGTDAGGGAGERAARRRGARAARSGRPTPCGPGGPRGGRDGRRPEARPRTRRRAGHRGAGGRR
ncbi:DUF4192 domain-containing protein [Streptomyces sp. XD-27]|uniref:DUF4192 domain-containing protein n=1 Tax=Streptomyces sp. XD-27 TaxID=3062779 RepID=UPI0026F44953|nr:DUF4192 domain-containing protein [Streptomyces sp. XD-27]WKX72989.1 DUF4192 domain-containing protein [Streptomyces sp. XD-27]